MCMLIQMMWSFHKVIVLQIIKAPSHNLTRSSLNVFRLFWTHQQSLFCHHQKTKSHIYNNMKIVVSFYYKFLRTHHARVACYHFGTSIPSVSKMQCTTGRVSSKRDPFKAFSSMNIVRDHHNRIIHRFIELLAAPGRALHQYCPGLVFRFNRPSQLHPSGSCVSSSEKLMNFMHFYTSSTRNCDYHILLIMAGNLLKESCHKLSLILVREP